MSHVATSYTLGTLQPPVLPGPLVNTTGPGSSTLLGLSLGTHVCLQEGEPYVNITFNTTQVTTIYCINHLLML